jgi:hypothetical protein
VEVIGAGCFYACRPLRSVGSESGSQLRRFERDAFADTSLTEVELPNSISSLNGCAFDRESRKCISFHPCPTNFQFRDEMLEDASGHVLVLYFDSAVS